MWILSMCLFLCLPLPSSLSLSLSLLLYMYAQFQVHVYLYIYEHSPAYTHTHTTVWRHWLRCAHPDGVDFGQATINASWPCFSGTLINLTWRWSDIRGLPLKLWHLGRNFLDIFRICRKSAWTFFMHTTSKFADFGNLDAVSVFLPTPTKHWKQGNQHACWAAVTGFSLSQPVTADRSEYSRYLFFSLSYACGRYIRRLHYLNIWQPAHRKDGARQGGKRHVYVQ